MDMHTPVLIEKIQVIEVSLLVSMFGTIRVGHWTHLQREVCIGAIEAVTFK